jgi:hypothetical protein
MGDTGTAEERQENWCGKLRRDIEKLRESYRESLRRFRDTCGRLRSVYNEKSKEGIRRTGKEASRSSEEFGGYLEEIQEDLGWENQGDTGGIVRDLEWEIQWRRRENCGRYMDLEWEIEERYGICGRYRESMGDIYRYMGEYDGGDRPWVIQR